MVYLSQPPLTKGRKTQCLLLMRVSILLCTAVFALVFLLPFCAAAQDTGLDGFNVLTFHPTADGSGVYSIYGTQTPGHLKPAARFTLQGMGALIEAGNPVNNAAAKIVDKVIEGDLSAAIGVGERLDFGLTVPVVFYERGMNVNMQNGFTQTGVGDLIIDAKAFAFKDAKGSAGLGFLARLTLPTGDPGRFTGWSAPTGEFRLIADKSFKPVYIVANAGYRIAAETQVRNNVTGASWNLSDDDRVTFGAGVQYTLPLQKKSWDLFADVEGDTVVKNVREITTPVIARGGVQKRFSNGIALQAGGGRGVTDALGSPSWHAFASISFDAGRRWRESHREKAEKIDQEISELIFFNFGDSQLSEAAASEVDKIAATMASDEDLNATVRGHTDSIGSASYNERLGRRRAETVAERMSRQGVDAVHINVESLGETAPLDSNKTTEGRARNRRVEILVR